MRCVTVRGYIPAPLKQHQRQPPNRNSSIATNTRPPHHPPPQQFLAYTFRTTLPADVPPATSTASVRYFYSAVLCIESSSDPYDNDEMIVVYVPFEVVASSSTITGSNYNSLYLGGAGSVAGGGGGGGGGGGTGNGLDLLSTQYRIRTNCHVT